jgi:formylglycine-generating enzyme required for sulfatase activity
VGSTYHCRRTFSAVLCFAAACAAPEKAPEPPPPPPPPAVLAEPGDAVAQPFNAELAGWLAAARAEGLPSALRTRHRTPSGETVVLDWVLVPSGIFTRTDDAGTAFEVRLTRSFYLLRTELSVRQWLPVRAASDRRALEPSDLPPPFPLGPETADAIAAAFGAELPTEAEWEYACREAGTNPHPMADLQNGEPVPVGAPSANALGLRGMLGNVAEWCFDVYESDAYAKAPTSDPRGSAIPSDKRVYRGGDYRSAPAELSPARRQNGTFPHYEAKGVRLKLSAAKARDLLQASREWK